MVAVARPELRKSGNRPMSKKLRGSATAVVAGNVPAPVRVRLKRVNCDRAIPYPPDGQALEWWQDLRMRSGTTSSAFVNASLQQLIAAARLPGSGISETAVNASLAFIELQASGRGRMRSGHANGLYPYRSYDGSWDVCRSRAGAK